MNVLVRALRAAREHSEVSAVAAPALRQFSSLVSLQNSSSQHWTYSRSQYANQHCSQQGCFTSEGHRLFSTGSDMTPEPYVNPGFPAVPTALDEDTVAAIVSGT